MTPFPRRGLYVITDAALVAARGLHASIEAALAGGARVVQYRDKSGDTARRREEAAALQSMCAAHGVALIINDDIELALAVGAAGVHLGKDDASLEEARAALPAGAIVGVSCYDSTDRALRAQSTGADYVAFGSFFPSKTKPGAVRASLDMLREIRPHITIPVVAIGGITSDNAPAALEAGADLLAVINAVFGAADPAEAASTLSHLFETTHAMSAARVSSARSSSV